MKRTFNGYDKTMTLVMDYKNYIDLMAILEWSSQDESLWKDEIQKLKELIEESDYESIWPEI